MCLESIAADLQAVNILWDLYPPDPASQEDLVMEAEAAQTTARLEQEKKVDGCSSSLARTGVLD